MYPIINEYFNIRGRINSLAYNSKEAEEIAKGLRADTMSSKTVSI